MGYGQDLWKTLDKLQDYDVCCVELGSTHPYINFEDLVRLNSYPYRYILHHYFPAPERPFVVNLSSGNSDLYHKSIEQILRSIEFCKKFNIKFLSFHAGFMIDPNEDFKFESRPISQEKALDNFCFAIEYIGKIAAKNQINIAIENNVLTYELFLKSHKNPLLCCDVFDYQYIFNKIQLKNVGILLDLGHLNVSSKTLGFSRRNYINNLYERIFAFHIHDNNRLNDTHSLISQESWFWKDIQEFDFKDCYFILEASNLNPLEIKNNIKIIKEQLERKHYAK